MAATAPPDATVTPPETSTAKEQWLVVDSLAAAPPDLDELLNEIQHNFGLDPYSARQRLLGRGYTLLLRGSAERLSPLFDLLTAHTIPAWLLAPLRPKTHPAKLQGLRRSAVALTLVADNAELTIDRDIHVVAILADLSGTVVANGVKQLLVRNAYQGGAAATQQQDEEALCRTIVKAQPVLDLYLLDPQGGIRGSVRALPGRYDPTGLGEEGTLSAGLNLLALIALARKSAGELTLRSDFGLANLPGCQLDTPLTEASLAKNLEALSRFGSLSVQIAGQKKRCPAESFPRQEPPPLLASQSEPATALPAPSDVERESGRRWMWLWGDTLGVVLVFIGLAFAMVARGDLSHGLWQKGIGSGAVPALLSLILLWRSFAAVRLKRMIENTPASRIRSLATGMVEVCGRAERCYALVTPVTQIPCIYYRLSRYHRQERNGSWSLTAQSSSGLHPFWLSDATGKVLVDPGGANISPASRQEGSGDGLNSSFLGRESDPDIDEKWVEESIPEGEMIYVLGFSSPRLSGTDSLHAATAARLRGLKGSSELRQRFDKDGDGQISLDEWDEARQVIADEVARTRLAKGQERRKQEEALVISAPARCSLPFVIAQSLNEKGVTRPLWWRSLSFLLAGLLLAVWALRQFFLLFPATGH